MQKTKYFVVFLGFIVFLNASLLFHNNFKEIFTVQEKKFQIQPSHESSLAYGEYIYYYSNAGENDKLKWEFSGSNSYVGITAFALTDTEFYKFQTYQAFYAYTLSDGSYYKDSGTFSPPSYDKWYVVFLNADPDMQITYLTYNVVVDRGFNLDLVSIIVPIIIGGIIVGVLIYLFKKKKEEVKPVTEIKSVPTSSKSRHSEMKENLKYCSQCGSSQKMNAVYCVKCGSKFD
ncbi:MAG: hypothetical protein ACFFG0_54160 [Candidatus Thorarchaeota archaeon]